ncbi:MAG: L,D-transpeptidase [Chthoniobacteraceae bacterium]
MIKRLLTTLVLGVSAAWLTGCANGPRLGGSYNATAYKPRNPDNVRIKVSLQNRAVYVMEGDRPLLVTATSIGTRTKPTPTGNFRVFAKIPQKRSGSYGFAVNGDHIVPTKRGGASGRYVGFPMAWWVEFASGYGFHEGSVWPSPEGRTHGCLRLHKNVAPKFYALAKSGTPVNIAYSQPEDSTLGRNLKRPTDYADPDPANSVLISDRIFSAPPSPLLIEGE